MHDFENCDALVGKKRALALAESEDEQEVVAAFLCYTDLIRRRQSLFASYQAAAEAAISLYVKYRGGIQSIRVFDVPNVTFQPEAICEKWFVQHFRFTHHAMDRVVLAFMNVGFPSVVRSSARDKCSLYDAMCMMCFKYSYPTRLGTMVRIFGSSVCRMGRLISALRRMISSRFRTKLISPSKLTRQALANFSAAVQEKSGLSNCVGFIDGTVRPICKPSVLQGSCYNGKDRVHALKYQGITTPDGMILQLSGPWPGARHDQFMVRESGIQDYMCSLPRREDGAMYVLYADQGYSEDVGIVTPYFDGAINSLHEAFNQQMASSRISVEWAFGNIVQQWASTSFTATQQMLSNRKVGQVYIVAAFLCNLLNTMSPNNTSQYFGVQPPSLELYLQQMYSPL
jgi:hypothetical protein